MNDASIDNTTLKYRAELSGVVSQKIAILTRLGYLWSRPDFGHRQPSWWL